MAIKNEYLANLYERVAKRNAGEPEFMQTVEEVLESLSPVADQRQDLIDAGVFDQMVEPERQIMFRVAWSMTRARPRSTAATASSSTAPSAPTRAACVSIRPSTLPS